MIIIDFKGIGAGDATYLLKKAPGKPFVREDSLNLFGYYEKVLPDHTRFVLWNRLEPKEFLKTRSKALSLEGYADPTGQCVDRYWLSQTENCLGELLKDVQTHKVAEQSMLLTIELPAVLLHHVCRMQEAFQELGWAVECKSLASQYNLEKLYPTVNAAGVYALVLSKTGLPALLYKEFHLLSCCFVQGPRYKPSEDQVTKLLRLGGNWLKTLAFRDGMVGFYLQGDRRLCAHAAKLLGTSVEALVSKEEVHTSFNLKDFLSEWIAAGMDPDVEFPPLDRNVRRSLNNTLKAMLQTKRVVEQAMLVNPFDKEKDASAFKYWETKNAQELLLYGLDIHTMQSKGLHSERHAWIMAQLDSPQAVLELGSNDGRCSEALWQAHNSTLQELALVDQDDFLLLRAEERLSRQRCDLHKCYVSNLMYADPRWLQPRFQEEWDAVVMCEVIEHLSPVQLEMAMRNLGKHVKTQKIVLTTPNREWNSFLMDEVTKRHDDHQFEWTIAEAEQWCKGFAARFGYEFVISTIGRELHGFGSPSIGIILSKKRA